MLLDNSFSLTSISVRHHSFSTFPIFIFPLKDLEGHSSCDISAELLQKVGFKLHPWCFPLRGDKMQCYAVGSTAPDIERMPQNSFGYLDKLYELTRHSGPDSNCSNLEAITAEIVEFSRELEQTEPEARKEDPVEARVADTALNTTDPLSSVRPFDDYGNGTSTVAEVHGTCNAQINTQMSVGMHFLEFFVHM